MQNDFKTHTGLLTKLAEKFNTDKLTHGYIPYYEDYFFNFLDKNERINLLEIGVWFGASIRMWHEFLNTICPDKFNLYGIDIDTKDIPSDLPSDVKIFIGNQADHFFVNSLNFKWNIIIDDASHNAPDQMLSLKYFFLNKLEHGGLYVIEDLHCNKIPLFVGRCKGFQHTALGFFQQLCINTFEPLYDSPENEKIYFNRGENKPIPENEFFETNKLNEIVSQIEKVQIIDEKIVFIQKK